VLAPTFFGMFFSIGLSGAFWIPEDGVYIHKGSNGKLLNLARLRTKTKVSHVLIQELLFADLAALISHTQPALQNMVSSMTRACLEFGLTFSLKKTELMAHGVTSVPTINIGNHILKGVKDFKYLGSSITSNLSLENELNMWKEKASSDVTKLSKVCGKIINSH
jgi:hypothetical protein